MTLVEWLAEALAPVTLSEYVPGAAVPACTVNLEPPPAVIELGLSVAIAPAGTSATVRVRVCALPEVTAVLMVLVPIWCWAMVRLLGLALIEKSLGGTVTAT